MAKVVELVLVVTIWTGYHPLASLNAVGLPASDVLNSLIATILTVWVPLEVILNLSFKFGLDGAKPLDVS